MRNPKKKLCPRCHQHHPTKKRFDECWWAYAQVRAISAGQAALFIYGNGTDGQNIAFKAQVDSLKGDFVKRFRLLQGILP